MSDTRFLIDLTTSREYKGHNAVGIVRTEREIGKALLAARCSVGFFHFDIVSGMLLMVPRHEAAAILGEIEASPDGSTSRRSGSNAMTVSPEVAQDQELREFLVHVRGRLDAAPEQSLIIPTLVVDAEEEVEFFDGDVVISAGLLWDGNFLEILYSAKQHIKLSVIQVVYDIVPIIMPEFCVPGMNIRFPKYLLDAAWTADALYCISDSTLYDVDQYLRKHKLPMPALRRIELGADLAKEHQGASALNKVLETGNFVLYVSTIEPRKNHSMLFHVWRLLFQSNREILVPLVIVGRHGWNSSDLVTMIQAAEHLYPTYIKIMTQVSDVDLDWLYRNSRFTLYPSLYEGWGLPVAESLARGKFCIAADTSSMPEVAAGFADLIDPLDLVEWFRRIRHFLSEPGEVNAREARIKEEYKIVSWASAMESFVGSVTELVGPERKSLSASKTSTRH